MSSTNDSSGPGDAPSERLGSLDVMRGFVVAGMILVNFSMVGAGFRQFAIYPQLDSCGLGRVHIRRFHLSSIYLHGRRFDCAGKSGRQGSRTTG
jgi:hypothetical protein